MLAWCRWRSIWLSQDQNFEPWSCLDQETPENLAAELGVVINIRIAFFAIRADSDHRIPILRSRYEKNNQGEIKNDNKKRATTTTTTKTSILTIATAKISILVKVIILSRAHRWLFTQLARSICPDSKTLLHRVIIVMLAVLSAKRLGFKPSFCCYDVSISI